MRRPALAIAAGALLLVSGYLNPHLPRLPLRADILVSALVFLVLTALLVWGLLPLRVLGRRLLLPGAAALAVGLLATRLGAVPVADVAKIVAATAVGR